MKKLSMIITCRDDDYIQNMINRIEYAINFNLTNIKKINKLRQFELIIVDWGSLTPISNKIKITDKHFKNKIKFLHIKKEIAEKYSKNTPGQFNQEIALNCGIVRSNSSHILITQHDILFSQSGWSNIFRIINDKTYDQIFLWLARINLSNYIFEKNFNFETLHNYLSNIYLSKVKISHLGMRQGGGAAGFLVKNKALQSIYGVSENLNVRGRYSGSDADLHQKLSLANDHKDSLNEGIVSFKLPINRNSRKNFIDKNELLKNNERFMFTYVNQIVNKKYGLNRYKINFTYPKKFLKKELVFNPISFQKKFNKLFFSKSIYLGLRNYLHTELDSLNLKEFLSTNTFLTLIRNSNIYYFVSIGKPKINRIAIISKNFPYLNIGLFSKNSKNFSNKNSNKVLRLSRYLNKTHNGYFRFILSKNLKDLAQYFRKINFQNSRGILEINDNNFSFKEIDAIISLLNNYFKKFNIIKLNIEINKKIEKKLLKKYENMNNGFYFSKSLKVEEYELYRNTLSYANKSFFNNNIYLFSAFVGIFVSKINKLRYFAIKILKKIIRI